MEWKFSDDVLARFSWQLREVTGLSRQHEWIGCGVFFSSLGARFTSHVRLADIFYASVYRLKGLLII